MPDTALAQTTFEISNKQLSDLAANNSGELEFIVFAHQFGRGYDRIALEVTTGTDKLTDVSPTNIYSAYGYVSIKNIKIVENIPHGDIDVFSFNYNPNETGVLHDKLKINPSVRDATDLIGPASEATTARVSKKDVILTGLKVDVEIDATLYDSVQYRAIRVNSYGPTPLDQLILCK